MLDTDARRVDCSACGFGATAIGWLMYHGSATFPEALLELGRRAGVVLDTWISPAVIDAAARDRSTLLDEVATTYQAELDRHADAGHYLAQRGVSPAMRVRYRLGFAPSDTSTLLDGRTGNRRRQLWQHGILIRRDRDTFTPRFRARLMIPIRAVDGTVIGFGGRTLAGATGDGARGPKYLNSPSSASFEKGRVLYGLYEARLAQASPERLVIVEGYLDVIALAGRGIDGAVATLGTAVTEAHLLEAFRHTRHVTLCFDGDDAGRVAAARAVERAMPLLRDDQVLDVVHLPPGDDPDTFVRAQGAATFRDLLARARPSVSVLLSTLTAGCDLAEIGGQARFGERVLERAASIRSDQLRQSVLDRASIVIGIQLELPVAGPVHQEADGS